MTHHLTPPAAWRDALQPCPFCGAGAWDVMHTATVVELHHWCAPQAGEPTPHRFAFVGYTWDEARNAANRRASNAAPIAASNNPNPQATSQGECHV